MSPAEPVAPPVRRAGVCDTASPARRRSRGRRPGSMARELSSGYLRSESELSVVVGICVACAVTLTPSARYLEARLPRRDRDAPNEQSFDFDSTRLDRTANLGQNRAQMTAERLDPELDRVARASLRELGDIRIDDVLLFIDRGLESMPSYLDLYHRWERQQWAVADLDFTPDRELWERSSDLDRQAALWSRRLFFNGEERVTATLAPFVWAAPTPEIEIFLSSQMVDEARHTVFFERWWREVVGSDSHDLAGLLETVRPDASPGYHTLFYDRLPGLAQRLASNPRDPAAFLAGVTLSHIVIEPTPALTGQRFELETMREEGQTHTGYYQGFIAVARDESRHVSFGIKVLQEAVREDPARFAPLIQRTLIESLPLIAGTLEPPDARFITEYGHTQDAILEFAMSSLNRRLRAIGINLAA